MRVAADQLFDAMSEAAKARPRDSWVTLGGNPLRVEGRNGLHYSFSRLLKADPPMLPECAVKSSAVLGWLHWQGSDPVRVDLEDHDIRFVNEATGDEFATKTATELPAMSTYADGDSVGAEGLIAGIRLVASATDHDFDRGVFAGIHVDAEGLTATDKTQLSHVAFEGLGELPSEGLTLFSGGLGGLPLPEPDGPHEFIAWDQNYVTIELGNTLWSTRRIEGEYPNWRKLLTPKKHTMVFPTLEFRRAVSQLRTVTADRVAISIWNGRARMTTAQLKETKATKDRPADLVEGVDIVTAHASCELRSADPADELATFEFGVNIGNVEKATGRAKSGDETVIEFDDAFSPMLLRWDHGVEMIMPLRLSYKTETERKR